MCGELRSQNVELQNMLDELRSSRQGEVSTGVGKERKGAGTRMMVVDDSLDSSMPLMDEPSVTNINI